MQRRFLALVIAIAWLAGCGGQSSTPAVPQNAMPGTMPMTQPTAPSNVNELPEPPVVRSVNGVAKVSLLVTLSGATGFPAFEYNGQSGVSPTISVKPGDTIVMDVTDELLATHGDKHDINVHFHGLVTSPKAPGDDVLGTLAKPGQKLHYVVHIAKNALPGLYWYHPHVHGQTNYQVGEGGMSGAIVIEGLEKHIPRLAHMRQRLIVMRDTGIGANAPPAGDEDAMGMSMDRMRPQTINSDPCGPELGLTTTLNGAYQPVITMSPGVPQFFRVVNATGHKTLKLAIDGVKLQVVAIDGFALDTNPGTPPVLTESSVIIPPAGRAEFVAVGPRSKGAKLRTLCYDSGPTGDRDPQLELASIVPPKGKEGRAPQVQTPLNVGAPLPQNAYTTDLPPIAAHRVAIFSEGNRRFFINGKAFSMSDPPMFVVKTGTVEEWRIVNETTETHDFHIHQVHFLVKEINGVKVVHPYWADTFVIPHRRSDGHPGTLVMLMDFRDPVIKGMFIFHCHILDHEDAGMMAKIQAI